MQYGEEDWRAGPVECGGVTVIGQYDYNYRWNGWLNPLLDAWTVEYYLTVQKEADAEYHEVYGYDWEWREEDCALILTDRQGKAEATEEYPWEPEVVEPDDEGLYALGTYSWTWSEDPSFYDNQAHQDWEYEASSVSIAARNARNTELHESGEFRMGDYSEQQKAGDAAGTEWLKTHPEPPNGRDETKVPGAKE